MRSLLRSICCVASAGCLLMACGSETPPDEGPGVVSPPPPPPPLTFTITPDAQTLTVGQTVTLQAIVSGNDKLVPVWTPYCESGLIAVAVDPPGTSATITAKRAGACFVWVQLGDGGPSGLASITIPPLPLGDACAHNSECASDAPVCGVSSPVCGTTCTRHCSADADCPASIKCDSSRHLCRAIPYPDDVCA